MSAKIKTEMSVGLTDEIQSALQIAVSFQGMKPSQYGRLAILEKLVAQGFLKHPGIASYEAGIKTAE